MRNPRPTSWLDAVTHTAVYIGEPIVRAFPEGLVSNDFEEIVVGPAGVTEVYAPAVATVLDRYGSPVGTHLWFPEVYLEGATGSARPDNFVARVVGYDPNSKKIYLDRVFGVSGGTTLLLTWIHPKTYADAIRKAIENSYPEFYERVREVRVIAEDAETPLPASHDDLVAVYVEPSAPSGVRAKVVGTGTGYVTVDTPWDASRNVQYLGFLTGDARGSYVKVSSEDSQQLNVYYDTAEPLLGTPSVGDVVFLFYDDSPPTWTGLDKILPAGDVMDVGGYLRGLSGRRILFDYTTQVSMPTFDNQEIKLPLEYVAHYAAHVIISQNLMTFPTTSDDDSKFALRWHAQEADRILQTHAMPRPARMWYGERKQLFVRRAWRTPW